MNTYRREGLTIRRDTSLHGYVMNYLSKEMTLIIHYNHLWQILSLLNNCKQISYLHVIRMSTIVIQINSLEYTLIYL